ncbi:pyruvate kinase [Solimonas marina]|uniref:Pyruvate kinase n=1 Tax=Solimonas marina TaxID=2714601 RepID=A0A969W513_9GAMM|nr:pyruvate kinase [Solimonas marina]NKF20816.1 pyruvate kinase [Solimonas marina]
MARRTKIVATLGPATDDPDVLRRVLGAGVDVVRLNFSHGRADDQRRRAEQVRVLATELGLDIGILADLQGPKIRIESFANGPIELQEGQGFTLDTALDAQAGDQHAVGCAYSELPQDVAAGDVLLLNDGAIAMRVDAVDGTRIVCTVQVGGVLSNRKGINKQGGGLSAAALTEKDKEDLRTAVSLEVDFIAVSFPRAAADMLQARELLRAIGSDCSLVAKIERAEALPVLREIVEASDAVMVARGDLGVEIGDAELPGWQKRIIAEAIEQNKMVITATQMMESMISSPIPTRAEVLDVANAVMDGTDAVMLSAETATGRYPIKVVEAMSRVCIGAEAAMPAAQRRSLSFDTHFARTDEAIAMATAWTAKHMHARAIVAMTESGATALMMSRSENQIPIYALTPHEKTRRRMALCRGVYPIAFTPSRDDAPGLAKTFEALDILKYRKAIDDGDRVLVTKGDGVSAGGTNTMKIMTVGEA